MKNDLWIIDVLRDIGDYASNRGHYRLMAAMEVARDEFLKDVECKDTETGHGGRRIEAQGIKLHQALIPLRKKAKH